MSTFTIELPDTVIRQIQHKGISQQQLESIFIRVIQLYLDETLPITKRTDVKLPQPAKTLLDVRGSIPVSYPQDFDAVRQQVIHTHIRQRMSNGK
jgi:hypothetical protein